MATAVCGKLLRSSRIRLTLLDNCGRPVYSPCSYIVSRGHLTITIEPEVEEGEEITQTNAEGVILFSEKPEDQIKWHNIEMEMGEVDPELAVMINPAWIKELDENGIAVGWRARRIVEANTGFALEIWLGTAASNICDNPNAQGQWGYLLFPHVRGGPIGSLEIGNDAINFTFNGKTRPGNRWGSGPYNIRLNATTGLPAPLITPLDGEDEWEFQITELAPPDPACGCQPLSNPAGPTINSVIEYTTDTTGMTARLTATTSGARPMQVDWGDGSSPASLTSATPTNHAYADEGTYTISVRFTDAGQETSYRQVTVPF